VKEQLAGGGVGVDALMQAAQLDAFDLEHLHGFGELPQAPGERPSGCWIYPQRSFRSRLR